MQVISNQNKKTMFTRMCIGEAVSNMLEDTPLEKIKISDIAKKAGVARMTFYKYYSTPSDALNDYMAIIVEEYIQSGDGEQERIAYMEYDHILFSLYFFDKYSDFLLKLYHHNLYSILIESVNEFVEKHIRTRREMSIYVMYSYAGSLLNTFLKWEDSGKKDSAEEIARTIAALYSH